MKFNEAQQKERIAHGLGSMAFALDVLVLIALAKLAGPLLAILWAGLSVVGGIAHYKQVMSLASPPTEQDLFTASGEVRKRDVASVE